MWVVAALLGLVVVAVGGSALLRVRRRSRSSEHWRALAPRLELTLEPDAHGRPPRLSGRYRGRQLELAVTPRGWAEVRTQVNAPLPRGLHLLHRDTARLLALRDLRDSRIGVPEFDHEVVVHSDHPAAVIRLLRDDPARVAVHTLLRDTPHAHVVGPDVYVRIPPGTAEPDVRATLRRLCDAADALEETGREVALQAEQARTLTREEPTPELAARRFVPLAEAYVQQREVLRAAARRRGLTYLAGMGPLVLGTVLFALGTTLRHALPPGAAFQWQLVGLFLGWSGVMLFTLGVITYRCPACRELVKPVNAAPGDREFTAISCPSCGVRLR